MARTKATARPSTSRKSLKTRHNLRKVPRKSAPTVSRVKTRGKADGKKKRKMATWFKLSSRARKLQNKFNRHPRAVLNAAGLIRVAQSAAVDVYQRARFSKAYVSSLREVLEAILIRVLRGAQTKTSRSGRVTVNERDVLYSVEDLQTMSGARGMAMIDLDDVVTRLDELAPRPVKVVAVIVEEDSDSSSDEDVEMEEVSAGEEEASVGEEEASAGEGSDAE